MVDWQWHWDLILPNHIFHIFHHPKYGDILDRWYTNLKISWLVDDQKQLYILFVCMTENVYPDNPNLWQVHANSIGTLALMINWWIGWAIQVSDQPIWFILVYYGSRHQLVWKDDIASFEHFSIGIGTHGKHYHWIQ